MADDEVSVVWEFKVSGVASTAAGVGVRLEVSKTREVTDCAMPPRRQAHGESGDSESAKSMEILLERDVKALNSPCKLLGNHKANLLMLARTPLVVARLRDLLLLWFGPG